MNLHTRFANSKKVERFKKIAWKLYYQAKKEKDIVSMASLDYFASFMVDRMKSTSKKLLIIKYSFPEKTFASRQKTKLSLLEKLTSQASDVQAIGSGVGIVNSFKVLYDSYMSVSNELNLFVPQRKSKEYIAAFKKDMAKLSGQIKSAALQYKKEALRAIKDNSILNKNNFYFQETSTPVRFFGENAALLMDRGGK
jgi:hypothetical protein